MFISFQRRPMNRYQLTPLCSWFCLGCSGGMLIPVCELFVERWSRSSENTGPRAHTASLAAWAHPFPCLLSTWDTFWSAKYLKYFLYSIYKLNQDIKASYICLSPFSDHSEAVFELKERFFSCIWLLQAEFPPSSWPLYSGPSAAFLLMTEEKLFPSPTFHTIYWVFLTSFIMWFKFPLSSPRTYWLILSP